MTSYVKCPVCGNHFALSPKGNVWAHKWNGYHPGGKRPPCPGGQRPPTLPGAVDQGAPPS